MGSTIDMATEMISYSFLIPIITDIIDFSREDLTSIQTSSIIAERIISSGVVIVVGTLLHEILRAMVKRFRGR